MPQNYQQMTEEQFETLMTAVNSGAMGEEEVFACTASSTDHLHVRLLGVPGDPASRLGVFTHGPTGMTTLFFSARDARALAEHFQTIAESIDGQSVSYDVPDDIAALLPPEDGQQ